MEPSREVFGITRSGDHYQPSPASAENLALPRRLDELHWDHLVYGGRRRTVWLRREGHAIDRKQLPAAFFGWHEGPQGLYRLSLV